MNKYKEQIENFIEEHKSEMLEKLNTFVDYEGSFDEKENVEKCTAWLRKEFEQEGFECRIEGATDTRAGVLIGILGKERNGSPVIFVGHTDTVFHAGKFSDKKFFTDDGKMYGPGVLDMKGGIIVSLYVAKALNSIGFDERPIKIIFAGDEEGDHVGTDADKILAENAKGAICAFNMETGQMDNCLCVCRKSLFEVYGDIKGIGGHSGNFFEKGANAVHEAVLKAKEMISLTDLSKGSTVTTSIFHGGDIVAKIPDKCEIAFDVRFELESEKERLLDSTKRIMENTFVKGTSTNYWIESPKFHSYEDTEDVYKLFNFINRIARENELPEFKSKKMGAASDSGNIQSVGVPIIDCCGCVGEFNHSKQEYAIIQSMYDRTKIWSLVVCSLSEF